MRYFILALACATLPAVAQEPEPSSVAFAAVFAEPGVPNFGPVQRMGLEGAMTARIELPDTTQALSVIWGVTDGNPTYLVLHQTAAGTSFTRFGGMMTGEGMVDTATDLELTLGLSDKTPLEVRVLRNQRLVLYRWPLSTTASAGGVPTAAVNPFGVGRTAPDFAVRRLDGSSVRLSDYSGQVVVLNWWSVTCAPCIEELPGLNALVDRFGDQAVFVAIGWDSAASVESLLNRFTFRYEQTLGDDSVTALFGETFPRHVVLDREGKVMLDKTGGSEHVADELAPAIEAALRN